MSRCRFCDRKMRGPYRVCPICAGRAGERSDISLATYPAYSRKALRHTRSHNVASLVLVLLTAATVIVNICVGGRAWSLYAVLGAYINYQVFLSRKLVEANLIQKFLSVVISACLLLVIVQILSAPEMAAVQFVIPIILYGALIVCGIIYFVNFRKQKSHIVPILFVIGLSLAAMVVSFLIFRIIKWPSIVLASITVALILVSLLFYRKPIAAEIRKKIHT